MKKIISTILASLCTGGLALVSIPVNAEINPQGQSILCKQQGWLTQIAISTPDFVTAICIDENDSDNINSYEPTPTHYVGQNKNTGGKVILPLSVADDSWGPGVPNFFKAVNGNYTYQMYVSNNVKGNIITLSVFDSGRRIYKYNTNKYLSGWK